MTQTEAAAILNSGTHPEPMYWALAAERSGLPTSYLTSTSFPPSSALMSAARLPFVREAAFAVALRRRELPRSLVGVSVVGVARGAALREEISKLCGREGDEVVDARMATFRTESARWVERRQLQLVVAQYTSASGAFQRSSARTKVLLYPIAHHDWMARNLQEEASINPAWSSFLQGAHLSAERRALLDLEIELASDIVVPSTFARQTFIDSGVQPARVHVLSLGSTRELADREPTAAKTGASRSPLRVLFAGQVNQRKGISYLLEAVSHFSEDQIELSMIGPATLEMRRRLASDFPRHRVSGSLPRAALMDAMRDADVLVLPSLAEGFGLVALEAMTMGTPAIVTDRTFGTDVVTNGVNGWVTSAGSTSSLRDVLQSLVQDGKQLDRVGERARRTAQHFSWDHYTSSAQRFLEARLS